MSLCPYLIAPFMDKINELLQRIFMPRKIVHKHIDVLESLKMRLKLRTLIIFFVFCSLIVILFTAIKVESPDGKNIDLSLQHQKELLTRWQSKRKYEDLDKDYIKHDWRTAQMPEIKESDDDPIRKEKNEIDDREDYDDDIGDASPTILRASWNPALAFDLSIKCIETMTLTPVTVCIHDVTEDIFISKELLEAGTWEPHIAYQMDKILKANPNIGVIDIGANIGFYSLIAAKMGHKVVAVEPFDANIKLFQKAALKENLQFNITVLQNAIGNKRTKVSLLLDPTNQGGIHLSETEIACTHKCLPTVNTILMDDLEEVVTFKKAFMKIDIEGDEHEAFAHASRLFNKVYIPFVFMEWVNIRDYYINSDTFTSDKRKVEKMIRWFTANEYEPFCLATGKALDINHWNGWGHDVFWKHAVAEFS